MKPDFSLRRVDVDGVRRQFRVYIPPDSGDQREWPAVLFLHGAGERGRESMEPTRVGIGPHLDGYPAVVIFPQCPQESQWSAPEARAIAKAALDQVQSELPIDPGRVALTGISMGGAGAWLLAGDQPERFAAVAPICGWLSSRVKPDLTAFAQKIARIPTWIFHGDADTIIAVQESRLMYTALQAAGADVRYTEMKGVAHNSWDPAYGKSGLMQWLINR
jgi:predicted peptidase